MELTTPSVFGIKFADNANLCLYQPSIYQCNEQVTVSSMEFYKRLNNRIGEFFDDNFDWSGVMIAGGLISGLVERKADIKEYEMSDIDLFVYDNNQCKKNIIEKMQQIYNYFVKKFDFYAFIMIPDTTIMNIIIPGKCSIQVIGTLFKNEMEILQSFDMTHCQIGFNGNELVFTEDFIKAIRTKVTRITKNSIHAYRLVKTYYRGYSIQRPKYCYIKNVFHEYTQRDAASGRPHNSDKFYDIQKLPEIIDELIENPIVIQNLTKNYIPPIHKKNFTKEIAREEMKKIGESYAGNNKYLAINDCNMEIFIEDIRDKFGFVRMPFPI